MKTVPEITFKIFLFAGKMMPKNLLIERQNEYL